VVLALIDFSVALPVAVGLFIGAGMLAVLASVAYRKENPPTGAIRRRGHPARSAQQDAEVR